MNSLKHLDSFQKVLQNYRVAEANQAILHNVRLVILVAPSSTGRSTLIQELVKTGRYHFIISDTTRQPRVNDGIPEQNGREYWFRSEEDILADLQAGKFLEAALIHNQQVSGINVRELQKTQQIHQIAITDVEIAGADNILSAKPDTMAIFVLPPSFEQWQQRLRKRGKMHGQEYRRRLESAVKEFRAAKERSFYHFMINDNLRMATQEIDQLVTKNDTTVPKENHQQLLDDLIARTQQTLDSLV